MTIPQHGTNLCLFFASVCARARVCVCVCQLLTYQNLNCWTGWGILNKPGLAQTSRKQIRGINSYEMVSLPVSNSQDPATFGHTLGHILRHHRHFSAVPRTAHLSAIMEDGFGSKPLGPGWCPKIWLMDVYSTQVQEIIGFDPFPYGSWRTMDTPSLSPYI